MTRAQKSTYDVQPQGRGAFDMESLVEGGPDIEVVPGDADFRKVAEDAMFMNELVTIRFLANGDPNAPKAVEISVNTAGVDGKSGGVSYRKGFPRNVPVTVPRYVVEAVAHAKQITLIQEQHPTKPMEMIQREQHAFYYPFEVTEDKNPKGRAWLEKVLRDPA